PWASHAANVSATVRLLEACVEARVARIIYSSSSSVYGDTPVLPKTETAEPLPRSPYAASKLAGEQYVLAFARAGLIEGVALRYFNVFGPRQSPHSAYAAVIPRFFQAALDERPAVVYGDGQQTRDFTYVDNVVEANLLAAGAAGDTVNGWVVNVGAGTRTALVGVVEIIGRIVGRPVGFVAINPRLPGLLGLLQRVRYVRTVVTSLRYVWTLLTSLAAYDLVHVFSASYFSFLLAPTPAVLLGKWYGKKVILNYRSGEAEDHVRRWRRTAIPILRLVDALVVPSRYLVDVFARGGLHASVIGNVVDCDQFRFRERRPLRPVFL